MTEAVIVICCISISIRVYCFDREIIQHKVDLFPLNSSIREGLKNNEIQLENGGVFYNFSDPDLINLVSKNKKNEV